MVTTKSGRKIRYDYYMDHAEPEIKYDYMSYRDDELFRMI